MTGNELLFAVLPYVAVSVAVVVTIVRWRRHPFSVSSLSSQLLESRLLYWGSVSFHWGLSLILLGHVAALLVPRGFEAWNGEPVRLYLLEITGLALAVWAGVGVAVLIWRRFSSRRVRAVTSPMDLIVLILVAVQIATGIWIAVGHRFGSYWGTSVMVPYVRSLFTLDPKPEYVDPLPFAAQAHVIAFYLFVLLFPFTRLVHIVTLPVGYLRRPWQPVVREEPTPAVHHPASDRPLERVR